MLQLYNNMTPQDEINFARFCTTTTLTIATITFLNYLLKQTSLIRQLPPNSQPRVLSNLIALLHAFIASGYGIYKIWINDSLNIGLAIDLNGITAGHFIADLILNWGVYFTATEKKEENKKDDGNDSSYYSESDGSPTREERPQQTRRINAFFIHHVLGIILILQSLPYAEMLAPFVPSMMLLEISTLFLNALGLWREFNLRQNFVYGLVKVGFVGWFVGLRIVFFGGLLVDFWALEGDAVVWVQVMMTGVYVLQCYWGWKIVGMVRRMFV